MDDDTRRALEAEERAAAPADKMRASRDEEPEVEGHRLMVSDAEKVADPSRVRRTG